MTKKMWVTLGIDTVDRGEKGIKVQNIHINNLTLLLRVLYKITI